MISTSLKTLSIVEVHSMNGFKNKSILELIKSIVNFVAKVGVIKACCVGPVAFGTVLIIDDLPRLSIALGTLGSSVDQKLYPLFAQAYENEYGLGYSQFIIHLPVEDINNIAKDNALLEKFVKLLTARINEALSAVTNEMPIFFDLALTERILVETVTSRY